MSARSTQNLRLSVGIKYVLYHPSMAPCQPPCQEATSKSSVLSTYTRKGCLEGMQRTVIVLVVAVVAALVAIVGGCVGICGGRLGGDGGGPADGHRRAADDACGRAGCGRSAAAAIARHQRHRPLASASATAAPHRSNLVSHSLAGAIERAAVYR